MKRFYFIFLFQLVLSYTFCQAYKAEYNCFLYNSPLKHLKDSGNSSLKDIIPMKVNIVYKVKCNSRYIDIVGYVAGNSLTGNNINFTSSNSRLIIDLKKQLVYYPVEKRMDTLLSYSYNTETNDDSCITYNISDVKSFNDISGCKGIYKNITPGLIIKNAVTGINGIRTNNYLIELKSFSKISWNPSFESFFKKHKQRPLGKYEFLED